jgi:hypothetical protein
MVTGLSLGKEISEQSVLDTLGENVRTLMNLFGYSFPHENNFYWKTMVSQGYRGKT